MQKTRWPSRHKSPLWYPTTFMWHAIMQFPSYKIVVRPVETLSQVLTVKRNILYTLQTSQPLPTSLRIENHHLKTSLQTSTTDLLSSLVSRPFAKWTLRRKSPPLPKSKAQDKTTLNYTSFRRWGRQYPEWRNSSNKGAESQTTTDQTLLRACENCNPTWRGNAQPAERPALATTHSWTPFTLGSIHLV